MRATGYVRVSTVDQAERGASLDAQKNTIASWVAGRGWQLADMAADTASGGSMKRRPGLERALERLDAGELDVLVVAKLDRLSRSTLDFALLMERASRNKWTLVVIDLGLDLSSMHGEFSASIWAAVAQLERRLISQRTRDGIAQKKRDGTYRGGKALPQAAEVPELVQDRIVELTGQGLSSRQVCARLELEGVPTLRGGPWVHTTVLAVLRRRRAAV